MQTIGEIALKEMKDAKWKQVRPTSGGRISNYSINQHENISRIDKYVKGEYIQNQDPTAIFWQLSTNRIQLYAKSIDADTKNFDMYGIGKFNWFKAFVANARFKKWAREGMLFKTLNETSTGIATYGSMVWKKQFDGKGNVILKAPKLSNLYFDATVENIIDTPVVEAHYMTETEIRNKWPEKTNEIIEKATKARDSDHNKAETKDDKYMILERWGEFKKEEDDDAKYYHWVGTGSGDLEVELVMDEIAIDKSTGKPKDFPYYDFHGERLQGRWQGLGVVERLYKLQEQVNSLVNWNQQTNEISSLLLFRTANSSVTGNVLDSVSSGQIINSDDMQQMGIDNRFINTFIAQLQQIEQKANELCFINDSISGETPPSGVPFRSLAVSTRGAVSTFNYIKQTMLEKMGLILQKEIMPDVVKEFNKEDLFEIMEQDIDIMLYDKVKVDDGIKAFLKKKAKDGFEIVFEEDIEAEKERILKELERGGRKEDIKIDYEFGIFMNVTGESVDKNTKNATIDSALQDMSANPAIVNTPLYQQKLEDNGINPFRLSPGQIQEIEQTRGAKLPEAPTQDKLSQLAAV